MRMDPQLHYLDNAATTMVSAAVAQVVEEALTKFWANPSSLYAPALEVRREIENARAQVAATLHCRADEIYFTAGGTEGNNLALRGLTAARASWADNIVTTGFEHPSVQRTLEALEKEAGWRVTVITPEADGTLDTEKLIAAVDKKTALVACMAVNNETGAVQNIAHLADAVKAKNSRTAVHVDAVQAWLRVAIDLRVWQGVDTLTLSGHKVHAPKGVGALFLRDSRRQTFRPPYTGGHQERDKRPGTENVPYILGLGVAAERGASSLSQRSAAAAGLKRRLLDGLEEIGGITINSPPQSAPEILNFSTGRVNSQTMIEFLGSRGVYVSGGSACDKAEPSHTLLAMQCADKIVKTALRVSFCSDNTPEDVDALLAGLQEGLRDLRGLS